MSNIQVRGTQQFMGHEIPVVAGGFGENKKCISDKTIAEIHGMQVFHVRELINRSIHRFRESVDIIDLKQRIVQNDTLEKGVDESDTYQLLQDLGYAKQSIKQAKNIFVLSERGYSKLIKIMDTDLAWEIHDQLMDEYFAMREQLEKSTMPDGPELMALALIEAHKTLEQKEKEIQQLTPKGIFADAVAASHTSILIGDLAKLLRQNGIEMGQKRLFAWLRENGYLIKRKGSDWNMPTQRSMEQGLFEIKESTVNNPDGSVRINRTSKVTGKGQVYFVNKFLDLK